MRTTFIHTLCELAAEDERVFLICGDLGYSVLEEFADRFPGQYLNAGVAEQNMTGVAAGLALSGYCVFTYSIANFPVMRCLEQIRNDICYHNLNVKIVSVGGGLAYGAQGYTHHGVEDLAVMRVLPNMTVIAPGDPIETRLATAELTRQPGPCYLRLGKAGETVVHTETPAFTVGASIELEEGNDLTLISTGGTLEVAKEAAEQLRQLGITPRLLSMHTLIPADKNAILTASRETPLICTVEEHGLGGLATVVAEVLAQRPSGCRLIPIRLSSDPLTKAGSQKELRSEQGLSAEAICRKLRSALNQLSS